jgi:hypothetical protein
VRRHSPRSWRRGSSGLTVRGGRRVFLPLTDRRRGPIRPEVRSRTCPPFEGEGLLWTKAGVDEKANERGVAHTPPR